MTVAGLALDASNRSPIVLLRDPSGHRQIPIWIDHAQAHNIVAGGQQTTSNSNSPLTHDLILSIFAIGRMKLEKVIIHAIEENNFQAVLKLRLEKSDCDNSEEKNTCIFEIQARPSDAIALAVRTKCTIWMLEEVFAEASIPVNEAADIKDQDEFRRFLSDVKPADLIRHLKENDQINENPFDLPDTENNKQS